MSSASPENDPLAAGLRKRDKAFLLRIALRIGVVVLLGVWLVLSMDGSEIGSCAARGFGNLTGS